MLGDAALFAAGHLLMVATRQAIRRVVWPRLERQERRIILVGFEALRLDRIRVRHFRPAGAHMVVPGETPKEAPRIVAGLQAPR